jgi:hypothetical protein
VVMESGKLERIPLILKRSLHGGKS